MEWVGFSEAYCFGTSFVLCILTQDFKFNPPVNFSQAMYRDGAQKLPNVLEFLNKTFTAVNVREI